VQNFVGKEVGQGGQGVDKVGHPHWGGRRPLVRAADCAPTSGWRPWVARDRRPPVGHRSPGRRPPVGCRPAVSGPPTAGRGLQPVCTNRLRLWMLRHFFYLFFEKKVDIFFSFFFRPLHVVRAWTSCGGVCTISHFLKCAPTLGSANSSKIHGEWRFHFFPKKKFSKFTSYMDLHICCWDFCFMKNLIP
jgi:hypothetical protein